MTPGQREWRDTSGPGHSPPPASVGDHFKKFILKNLNFIVHINSLHAVMFLRHQ